MGAKRWRPMPDWSHILGAREGWAVNQSLGKADGVV